MGRKRALGHCPLSARAGPICGAVDGRSALAPDSRPRCPILARRPPIAASAAPYGPGLTGKAYIDRLNHRFEIARLSVQLPFLGLQAPRLRAPFFAAFKSRRIFLTRRIELASLDAIRRLAKDRPTVYLPTHDPPDRQSVLRAVARLRTLHRPGAAPMKRRADNETKTGAPNWARCETKSASCARK